MSTPPQIHTISFRTNDFEKLQKASAGWQQEFYRMEPGRFEGRLDLTQVGTRQILRERWNRKITYRGTTPEGTCGIALPFRQSAFISFVGTQVGLDSVIMQAPGHEADLVSPGDLDMLALAVPKGEVETIVSALSGRQEADTGFHGIAPLSSTAAARLRSEITGFLQQSVTADVVDEERLAGWSDQIVKICLWEIEAVRDDRAFAMDSSKNGSIVRTATDLVFSDPKGALGLTDICARLGIGLRTVHYAFQDVTGMSPATWLRRLRLNNVHKLLRSSAPCDVKVSQVAKEHGFVHQGHFGQQYKRLFDCTPSETLLSTRG